MLRPSRILRIAQSAVPTPSWTDTLSLPQTSFPPRATPAEQATYLRQASNELYAWQKENRLERDDDDGDNTFVLHDGPPYANGAVHAGHAVNKILKDMILRINLSAGSRVSYRPGWDCHGLPIELKALRSGGFVGGEGSKAQNDLAGAESTITGSIPKLDAPRIRELARKLATETVENQRETFKSWGVMGDWEEPYLTMDKDFEKRQLEVFKQMVAKGLIYRQNKPVYWSPSSQTALAEAELEYEDSHKATAAYVKFPLTRLPAILADNSQVDPKKIAALIWTTTPWTLPANTAIGIRSNIIYSLLDVEGHGLLIVAKERLADLSSHFKGATHRTIIDEVPGKALLEGTEYLNVLSGKISRVIHADLVTSTSGTGLVHMAAGHGMEDYAALKEQGFDNVFAPVDENGKFTSEALPSNPEKLKGLYVESKGTKAVLEILEAGSVTHAQLGSLVLDAYSFSHRNPIDWRTKQPVIVRATHQWFADVANIQPQALKALANVLYLPDSGKRRLEAFIKGRTQWCISRQRSWGVPIPALYRRDTGEALMTTESIDHIINVVEERGTDAWWTDPADDPTWVAPSLPSADYVRGQDTMDVWFDSGSSWAALPGRQGEPRADVYVEGTDQHRGWFQSSVLTHVAAQQADEEPKAPFKVLITHGFTLDSNGRKMSKSLGNVVTPEEILGGALQVAPKKGKNGKTPPFVAAKPLSTAGCDALRLWVASSDYTRDMAISQDAVTAVHQTLAKFRVTFKWLLGVLSDYPHAGYNAEYLGDMTFCDHVLLQRLRMASEKIWAAQTSYDFARAVLEIKTFVNTDLSTNYFEIIKDRIYAGDVATRLHTQSLLYLVLDELMAMLAPICPVLVAEVWTHMPEHQREGVAHPLHRIWEPFSPVFVDGEQLDPVEFEKCTSLLKDVTSAVKTAQEEARKQGLLGSGLACNVDILLPQNAAVSVKTFLAQLEATGELDEFLVVSAAEVLPMSDEAREEFYAAQEQDEELAPLAAKAREWRENVPWVASREFEVPDDAADEERVRERAQEQAQKGGRRRRAKVVVLKQGKTTAKVTVMPARDGKCVRCWRYKVPDELVETEDGEQEKKELCDRCDQVLLEASEGEEEGMEEGEEGEQGGGEEEGEEEGEEGYGFDEGLLDHENLGRDVDGRSKRGKRKAGWRNMFRLGRK